MSSPLLWGPNNKANNLEEGAIQPSGIWNSQQGPVNYCTLGNFANGATTGWSLGTVGTLTNGIPTGTPTFGSGTTNLAISATASGQSLSAFALSLAASTATTVGNMVATNSGAMIIALEDQAKVLTFKFYYSVSSGVANCNFSGTSSNSFGIAFWDSSNSVWLSSTANFGMTQSSGVGYVTGTLQTGITTAGIQMCVYAANATAGAATLLFTDFFLGPQTAPLGAVCTDWVSYPITITGTGSNPAKGTVTTDVAEWRRVGDSMEIRYQYLQSAAGSAGSGTYLFNLPSGYSANTSKITPDTGANFSSQCGSFSAVQNGGVALIGSTFLYDTTHFSGVGTYSNNSAGAGFAPLGASTIPLNSTAVGYGINALVPIAGWSSNVQMSSDTDTRVVAAIIKGTPQASYSANTIVILGSSTVLKDTHAAYNTGTGQYQAPVTGFYVASCLFDTNSASNSKTAVYVNGTKYLNIGGADSGDPGGTGTVYLNAGDLLDFRFAGTWTASGPDSSISINRVCGPSVIAATESVNARYFSSTTSISGSLATIVYATKGFDSHNAYNNSTGIYTCPVSGKYQVNSGIATAGTIALNNALDMQVQQSGSSSQISESLVDAAGAVSNLGTSVSDTFYCLAGDTIKVQVSSGATLPTIVSSNNKNFFSITRVGN